MTRPSFALLSLREMRDSEGYPFTRKHIEMLFEKGIGGPLGNMGTKKALAHLEGLKAQEQFVKNFILETAKLYPGSGLERVEFAFLVTDNPNAVVFHEPQDNSFAIGLDHGMFDLFGSVFAAAVHAMERKLENLYWVEAMLDFVIVAFSDYPARGLEERVERRTKEMLYLDGIQALATRIAVRFLIAHELAHIHLGHFTTRRPSNIGSVTGGNATGEISTFDHDSEHEADQWARTAVLQAAAKTHQEVVLSVHVPCIYFIVVALAKTMYSPRIRLGEHMTDSHPDVWERASRLLVKTPGEDRFPPDSFARRILDLRQMLTDEFGNPAFQAAAAHARAQLDAFHARH
jgi:hypothetical protein